MIHFSTFADGDWGVRQAGTRLLGEAVHSGIFNSSRLYSLVDLNDVDTDFSQNHSNFIMSNPRGFGFCFWKPTYLLKALSNLAEDDILVSLDAGCQLNINDESVTRFKEYCEVAFNQHGLFMQLRDNQFGINDLSDRAWCNSLLIEELKPSIDSLNSNQVQAGILIIRNSPKIRNLLLIWKYYCEVREYKFILGGDLKSQTRWEQSIFSLLVKKDSYALIPDESYWYPEWSHGLRYPIWAMRNRSGGDAYRRNVTDLFQILLARIGRRVYRLINQTSQERFKK